MTPTIQSKKFECFLGYHKYKYTEVRWTDNPLTRKITFIKTCKYCKKEVQETYDQKYLISNYEKLNPRLRAHIVQLVKRQKEMIYVFTGSILPEKNSDK